MTSHVTMSRSKPRGTPAAAAALLLSFALAACSEEAPVVQTAPPDSYTEFTCTAPGATPGQPRAYFAPFDQVEQQALCVLDLAQEELLVAHYNIRRESFLYKLTELAARGVTVKVAVDENNADKEWNTGDDFLEENGVHLIRTKPSGSRSLMHLKVAVIDSQIAMTGSFNWNGTAALANDENMVALRDPEVVARYRNQVLEVLGDKPHEVEGGPATDIMALHFAPEERLDDVLVERIDQAQSSIDVAMFTYTSKPVSAALVAAVGRGVRVRAVVEYKQTGFSTVDDDLEQAGGLVVRGANRIGSYSAMHHKYAVIDERLVITGATNWTYAGTRKNEEDLLLVDSPELAAAYLQSFADLLHIYAGLDVTDVPPATRAGVLLHTIHEDTEWGDRMVVTGDHPTLGSWDPWRGIDLDTSGSLFPNWTGRAKLPAGTRLEYKFVTLTASGQAIWEPGANRVLQVPASGRAVVMSGPFGDTSINYTPLDTAP